MHVIIVILLALGALAVVSAVGLAVLSFLRPDAQRRILPAAPLLGVAALVVALHWTGLVVGVRWGIWIVLAIAAVIIVTQSLRGRLSGTSLLAGLPATGIVLAVGAVGAAIAWMPLLLARDAQLVQAGGTYDAFYYVSTSRWLIDHSFLTIPPHGTAPGPDTLAPIFGPATTSITFGLRLGQEMIQSGFAAVLGVSQMAGFLPWLGLWVLLLPGGIWVLGSVFGVRRWFRAFIGLASVVSVSLVMQTLAANADSLLGVALVPLVLALFVWALRSDPGRRVPIVLAALAVTALVGTYTEYGPFVVVMVAALALIGPRAGYGRRLARAAVLVGVAVVLNPIIWWRAVVSLGVTGGVAANQSGGASLAAHLRRLLGPFESVIFDPHHGAGSIAQSVVMVLLLVGLLTGVILGLRDLDTRGLSVGTLGVLALALFFAFRGNDYVTGRVSGMVFPILIAASGICWSRLLPAPVPASIEGTRSLRRWVSAGTVGVVVLGGFVALNARASVSITTTPVSESFVRGTPFTQAARWVAQDGGARGGQVSVATATLFDQLWLSDALGDRPGVSYISLRNDLGYRADLSGRSFWNGELDRYLLVGPGAYIAGSGSELPVHNDRFTFVDTQADGGEALVAVPVQEKGRLSWVADDRGGIAGMSGSGIVLLSGRDSAASATLSFRDGKPGDRVTVSQQGRPVAAGTVDARGRIDVPLQATAFSDGVARLQVAVSGDGPLTLGGLTR